MKQFIVTGMGCAACSARVEKAVSALPGVTSCSVNLLTNTLSVEGTASNAEIIKAVEDAGYGATEEEAEPERVEDTLPDEETDGLKNRLLYSLCILIPLMYVSMGHMMWNWPLPGFLDNHPFPLLIVDIIHRNWYLENYE